MATGWIPLPPRHFSFRTLIRVSTLSPRWGCRDGPLPPLLLILYEAFLVQGPDVRANALWRCSQGLATAPSNDRRNGPLGGLSSACAPRRLGQPRWRRTDLGNELTDRDGSTSEDDEIAAQSKIDIQNRVGQGWIRRMSPGPEGALTRQRPACSLVAGFAASSDRCVPDLGRLTS